MDQNTSQPTSSSSRPTIERERPKPKPPIRSGKDMKVSTKRESHPTERTLVTKPTTKSTQEIDTKQNAPPRKQSQAPQSTQQSQKKHIAHRGPLLPSSTSARSTMNTRVPALVDENKHQVHSGWSSDDQPLPKNNFQFGISKGNMTSTNSAKYRALKPLPTNTQPFNRTYKANKHKI